MIKKILKSPIFFNIKQFSTTSPDATKVFLESVSSTIKVNNLTKGNIEHELHRGIRQNTY